MRRAAVDAVAGGPGADAPGPAAVLAARHRRPDRSVREGQGTPAAGPQPLVRSRTGRAVRRPVRGQPR